MLTLISHFYNESFLLPFWLDHHRRIFDHAVLIDYKSTDNSRDIIKEICPHWEVRNSENVYFDAFKCDDEVMKIEREFSGWKVALNATEFIVNRDLRQSMTEVENTFPSILGFTTAAVIMVDNADDVAKPITKEPLLFQRRHGWHDPPAAGSRHRTIHKARDGRYSLGRHFNQLDNIFYNPDIYTCWFGWCPYPYVKGRKLQIQTKIPPYHIGTGIGNEHQIDAKKMDEMFEGNSKGATDLLAFDKFANELNLCKARYYPELCEVAPLDPSSCPDETEVSPPQLG